MTELLDRLLTGLDVEVEAFAVCEVGRGWRLAFGPDGAPTVHYGLAGSGVMVLADGRRYPIARDTLLLLPPGNGQSFELPEGGAREFRPDPRLLARADRDLRIRAGGKDDVGFAVACGRIRASYAGVLDVLAHLDDPVVESFAGSRSLRDVLQAVLAEFAAPTVGTRALTSALLKQCLVLLLRRRSASPDGAAPWLLPVLGDPRLANAVLAMLERPAEPHSLGDLADLAGMSRSGFAGRFSAVLGRAPIEFLREVRLRRAARLLETTDLPVGAVAGRVGYASRGYFSRAFKELYGTYPTDFRAGRAG